MRQSFLLPLKHWLELRSRWKLLITLNHDPFADLTARKMFPSPKTSGAKFSITAYVVTIDRFQAKIAGYL
jgi:hypothetical protein